MFYIPSFKIYGSVAGFYDYGPPGCAIKQNITQVDKWQMLEDQLLLQLLGSRLLILGGVRKVA